MSCSWSPSNRSFLPSARGCASHTSTRVAMSAKRRPGFRMCVCPSKPLQAELQPEYAAPCRGLVWKGLAAVVVAPAVSSLLPDQIRLHLDEAVQVPVEADGRHAVSVFLKMRG